MMTASGPRYRTRELTAPTYTDLVKTGLVGTGDETFGPYLTAEATESMTDVVTPNYRKLVADGVIVNNACSYTKTETLTSGPGFGDYKLGSTYHYTLSGPLTEFRSNGVDVFYDHPDSEVDRRTLVSIAKLNALANIDVSEYAFGEDLLELKETVRFLRNPIGSLVKVSESFRRVVRSKMLRHGWTLSQALAEVWLTYRFALTPLIRSAFDAAKAFEEGRHISQAPPRLTARGFAHDKDDNSSEWTSGQYTWARNTSQEIHAKASILYALEDPLRGLPFHFGLRGKDHPETLWQIMRLSFMIDRVVDVSSFIRGVTNLTDPNVKILAASTTVKTEDLRSYQLVDQNNGSWVITINGDVHTSRIFSYVRDPWLPSFVDTIPSVSLKGLVDDSIKLADLLSIVISNLKGYKPGQYI